MRVRVAIIGAGLAGLSAACHLAKSGHQITVYEASGGPGGRAGTVGGEYVIDDGPTVLTMVELVEEAVSAAGSRLSDLVELIRVDPAYKAFFSDGKTFDGDGRISVHADTEAMRDEIKRLAGENEADAYLRFVAHLAKLYEVEFPNFIDRNFNSPLSVLRPAGAFYSLLRLKGFNRLDQVVSSYFQDQRLRRIFSFQALYAGLSPLKALGIYAVIAYMDSVKGVWFPRGGMNRIPLAMETAAKAAGVRFEYGSRVERLVRTGNAVRGIELSGRRFVEADVVIATADRPLFDQAALPNERIPARLRYAEYSPSAFLMLLGTNEPSPSAFAHHNIFFGAPWKESFEALLERGQLMRDPSVLVSLPTLTDPALAPPGKGIVYALEPVPNLSGKVDWLSERERVRNAMLDRLQAWGVLSDPSAIASETTIDPLDWLDRGMALGTPFSVSHRFFQSGPFRAPNQDPRFSNLLWAGSSTVPGVGIPMVLTSGKLAAKRVMAMGARP
ncbi:MAG: phytoene desaturase family protein [Actinomycetota bacterium]|nr:phytoene desaturase family protein [Actinomycetota bacterium]